MRWLTMSPRWRCYEKVANVLSATNGDAIKRLNTRLKMLKMRRALKEFGFREGQIDRAAEIAVRKDPREIEKGLIKELLHGCVLL